MEDNTTSPELSDIAQESPTTMPEVDDESSKDNVGDSLTGNRQDIFDARYQAVMEVFGKACVDNGVELAIAIAKHPLEQEPMVFVRGHVYDAACLSSKFLKQFKQTVVEDLDN